ncbi:MAG: tetratricopeptide repeat protein [Myxococcales bacterium]
MKNAGPLWLLAAAVTAGQPAIALAASPGRDVSLGKKETSGSGPDISLAGDVRRKKPKEEEARPALSYDSFRFHLELQVAGQRRAQMDTLKKIIALGSSDKEMPDLIFQYAELSWEESRYLFFEANRRDDDYINAKNRGDQAGMQKATTEKADLLRQSGTWQIEAIARYKDIVRRYPKYQRMDEVLYFLGHNLWDQSQEKEALGVYKLLVVRYPQSKYVADAYLAFGEYYFDNSNGQRPMLIKALAAYKKAASFPENKVYLYALYKQGWCHYNLGDFAHALDMFKTVILYADLASSVTNGSKLKLAKDARKDYVLTYSRDSRLFNPLGAKDNFLKVGGQENYWPMLKGLAGLYFDDGKDKEAVLTYRQLIRDRPLSPEAPFFQARIVDATMRVGNKKFTADQAKLLVQILLQVQQGGMAKTEDEKKDLARAEDLAERTLSNLAVTWHNEGKKTRDEETFALDNQIYRNYLTLFPKSPKAYSLHFYHGELLYDQLQDYGGASREYDWVVTQDIQKLQQHQKPGKWFGKAAEDAVYAWEEVARQAGASAPPPVKSTKELPIPPSQQGLVDACERYVKYFATGPKVVEINYKVARIYYAYNHFAEAVKGFLDIALNHPDAEVAQFSANLVLDSYNLLGDFQKVHDAARKFLSMPKLAKGKFRDDLTKIIEESGFKLVEAEEKAGHFEDAARKYLGFAADFPKGDRADQALWNASIDFYKAGDFEASIKARRQIISSYPQSQLMPKALFSNAQSYESTADFAQAASAYERYAAAYEKQQDGGAAPKRGRKRAEPAAPGPRFDEGKAQEGLINAAVYRAGMRQYAMAIKDREAYLRLWPVGKRASGSDSSEQVFASIADVYERQGKTALAIKQLEEHAKHVMRDPDAYLKVQGKLLELYERSHNERLTAKLQKDLFDFYKHSSHRKLSPEALDVVAKASYAMNDGAFAAFEGQKLHLPEGRLIKDVKAKAAALLSVQDQYTKTVKLGSGDPAICSLWRIGLAYQKFAQALYDAPVPPALRKSEQLVETYKDQISQQAMPAENKAKELYASAVQKSRELGIYNDCAAKAFAGLRKYDPASYGEVPEAVVPVPAHTTPAAPDGIAVAIGAPPSPAASGSTAPSPAAVEAPAPPAATAQSAAAPAVEETAQPAPPPADQAASAPPSTDQEPNF